MKRVLVIGAAGYLGGHVVERLHDTYQLTLADRVAPDGKFSSLRFLPCDITRQEDVLQACEGQDAVVNLVALVRERHDKPPSAFADVMVKGAWHVAHACVQAGVKRLVSISSVIACGGMPRGTEPCPPSRLPCFGAGDLFYCLSKHLGEQIGLAYHQAHGLSVIHLRPGVIAGDGANAGPQAPAEINGPWFVYVDPRDVAQAVELAIGTEAVEYGCYNIVAGREDALFDWSSAAEDLGYRPRFNWPELP